MQPRPTPRTVPDRPIYLTLNVVDLGVTTWRMPSALRSAEIFALLQEAGIAEAAEASDNDGQLLQQMSARLPVLFACQGALLGLCWFDPSQDLETARKDHATLSEYGAEVYEELHEAGWGSLGSIQAIWQELTKRLVENFVTQKEVSEKKLFLEPTPGASN